MLQVFIILENIIAVLQTVSSSMLTFLFANSENCLPGEFLCDGMGLFRACYDAAVMCDGRLDCNFFRGPSDEANCGECQKVPL